VLGFTRNEIGRILLGEQGLLKLGSIPAGFAIGFLLSMLLSQFFSRELFRLPLVVNAGTYAFAAIVVTAAALFSGAVVGERLRRLDLTAVLKSRE
jgi:putative ABC transport system permease protein